MKDKVYLVWFYPDDKYAKIYGVYFDENMAMETYSILKDCGSFIELYENDGGRGFRAFFK